MQCGILTAVVDENDFVIVATALKCLEDSLLKGGHIFRFVLARSNQGKFHGNQLQYYIVAIIPMDMEFVKNFVDRLGIMCYFIMELRRWRGFVLLPFREHPAGVRMYGRIRMVASEQFS